MPTKRTHEDLLAELRDDVSKAEQAVVDFETNLKARHLRESLAAACPQCDGVGWLIRSSMDENRYYPCPSCNGKPAPFVRSTVPTPAEQAELDTLAAAVATRKLAYQTLKAALDPFVIGRRVRVYKGRKVPIGTVGTVFWTGTLTGNVGSRQITTPRLGVTTDTGHTVWVNAENCEGVVNTL